MRVKASVKTPHFEWGAVKHGRYVIIEGSITLQLCDQALFVFLSDSDSQHGVVKIMQA